MFVVTVYLYTNPLTFTLFSVQVMLALPCSLVLLTCYLGMHLIFLFVQKH